MKLDFPKLPFINKYLDYWSEMGPVAQWITCLNMDQKSIGVNTRNKSILAHSID